MIRIDFRALRERAREGEGGEAFEVLARGSSGRVGVGIRLDGARAARYFVEVVLNPSPDRPCTGPGQLGRIALLAERLKDRGYDLRVEEDGCVTGEVGLGARRIVHEVDEIQSWLGTA